MTILKYPVPPQGKPSHPGRLLAFLLPFLLCLLFGSAAMAGFIDTSRGFVQQQYRDYLGRDAENAGIDFWASKLDAAQVTKADIGAFFFASPEFQNQIAPVARLYFAYFNRIPDYLGILYWLRQMGAGVSLQTVSDAFATSPEFIQTYGTLSNSAFIDLVYMNVLGRPADASGKSYWLLAMQQGTTRGAVMKYFSESPEYQKTSYTRVQVSMMYMSMLRRGPEQDGFDFWVQAIQAGAAPASLVGNFLGSPEYHNRFATLAGLQATWTQAVAIAAQANLRFLVLNQQWEGGNWSKMDGPALSALANSYYAAGEQLVNALKHVNVLGAELNALQGTLSGVILPNNGGSVPGGGTIPVTLPINVGNHISNGKTDKAACDKLYPNEGEPNYEAEYRACLAKALKDNMLASVGTGTSATAGVLAGLGAKLIVGGAAFAGSGAAITVGGPILVGAGVALGVKLLWSWCTSGSQPYGLDPGLMATGDQCQLQTADVNPGQKVPVMIPGSADLMISIPGYVPILIKNFSPPEPGTDLQLDFDPIPADPNFPGQVITIDYNELPYVGDSCDDIGAITASHYPLDPGSGVGVTVTGQLIPAVSGCATNYNIVGTDGYSNSETKTSAADGTSSFYIPGGACGVNDVVTVAANGITFTVTYTFGAGESCITLLQGGQMPRIR